MATYYKVVCGDEQEMTGLGYEEIYGSRPRFFWSRPAAERRAAELNSPEWGDAGCGSYRVESRQWYDDGSWDDEGDDYAQRQLTEEEPDRAAHC